jgi:hypothetical protein
MPRLYEIFSGEQLKIAEKIQQRRYQMLVHSYIYYEMNENIVSDSKWSSWATELAELQSNYPEIAKEVPYADDFADWDGSSGAFLDFSNKPNIKATADRLLHNRQPKKPTTLFAPTKPKNQPLFAPKQTKPLIKQPSVPKKKLF